DQNGNPKGLVNRKGAVSLQTIPQRFAFEVFHREVRTARAINGKNLEHAGMVQSVADLQFALKSRVERRGALELKEREFESDRPTGAQVHRFEHRAHATAPEQFEDGKALVEDFARVWFGDHEESCALITVPSKPLRSP